jgi:hypothetical protein
MLSRLRHRSYGVTWLFALLIVFKVSMGVFCISDDYPSALVSASAAASVLDGDARSESVASVTFDETDPPCWHAGAGGCHCNCMHAPATFSSADPPWPMDRSWHRFAPMNSAIASLSPKDLLRPPIA